MKRLREQCANLLSRNKWTRNSSVTTHKSSSMTPFLIQYRGMTCHVKCHDLPITQPSFLDFAISKAVRNSCSSPIFIFEKSASMALRAWVRSRASSWAVYAIATLRIGMSLSVIRNGSVSTSIRMLTVLRQETKFIRFS